MKLRVSDDAERCRQHTTTCKLCCERAAQLQTQCFNDPDRTRAKTGRSQLSTAPCNSCSDPVQLICILPHTNLISLFPPMCSVR